MALFEIILLWVHVTAATFWVGGMLFLSLVAVPLLKKAPDPASAQREFVSQARRFRMLVWVALSLIVPTGALMLPLQVDVSRPIGAWPLIVLLKLGLVVLLVSVSLAHDQFIGSKVRLLRNKPALELTGREKLLIRLSPLVGRLTLLLGLGVFWVGLAMARF